MTDAQIHDLLVSQEEKGAIHTGLKRWRLRRSRRLAMDLPPHERWDCPNQVATQRTARAIGQSHTTHARM